MRIGGVCNSFSEIRILHFEHSRRECSKCKMRISLNELQTPPIRMAYLVSRYPAISHTFILREVAALRERNFEICVASINEPDRPLERLTEAERAEAGTTFYLKRAGAVGALVANLDAFL